MKQKLTASNNDTTARRQMMQLQSNRIMGKGHGHGLHHVSLQSNNNVHHISLYLYQHQFLSSPLLYKFTNSDIKLYSTHSPQCHCPVIYRERERERLKNCYFGLKYTMKKPNWHIIFLCLFTASFCIFSSCSISLTGRKLAVKLMSLPHPKNRYPKPKVVEETGFGWQSSEKGSSMSMEMQQQQYSINNEKMDEDDDNEEEEEVVHNYHIDYHGVATHPTPTPKHPIPIP